jgi:hypothetical protein
MPEYVLNFDTAFLCAATLLNAFGALVYGLIYLRRRRAIGFLVLSIVNLLFIYPTLFMLVGGINYRSGYVFFDRETMRVLDQIRMIVISISVIGGFFAPLLILRYVLSLPPNLPPNKPEAGNGVEAPGQIDHP